MTEKVNEKLNELTKWPDTEDEVTVDLMLRIVGSATQRTYLEKWAAIDKSREHFRTPLYVTQVELLIAAVGFMGCLRALNEVNPEKALEYARWYWGLCDAGDSLGEFLWEFTEKAGLDPHLIQLDADDSSSVPAAQERNSK